jgi:hypothetical protein
MSSNVTKRALSAGLGVGALALLAPRASADTPFSSFAFPVTGAPTARTLPDRLGELKNVKDFGARGDGSTNDTAAIQAAIDRQGTIYFPPGKYRLTSSVNIGPDKWVELIGTKGASVVGSFNGFLFDTPTWNGDPIQPLAVNNISMTNDFFGNSAGCIRANGGIGVYVERCFFAAWKALVLNVCLDVSVRDCVFRQANDTVMDAGIDAKQSIGIHAYVNNGSIQNCDFAGYYKAINVQQSVSIRDCRMEMCDRGIVVGSDINGGDYPSNAIIEGCEMEANNIHIHLQNAGFVIIRYIGMLGDAFTGIQNQDPRLPGQFGILINGGEQFIFENVSAEGCWADAGISFAQPVTRSIFMCTTATLDNSQVDPRVSFPNARAWKGVETLAPGNVIFMQCNQPTS